MFITECTFLLRLFACFCVLLCLKCRVPVQLSIKDYFLILLSYVYFIRETFFFKILFTYLRERVWERAQTQALGKHLIPNFCLQKQFCDVYIGSLESIFYILFLILKLLICWVPGWLSQLNFFFWGSSDSGLLLTSSKRNYEKWIRGDYCTMI